MQINIIFSVPADTDVDLMDDAVQLAIAEVDPIYPPEIMGGTRVVGSRKLIYAVIRAPDVTEETIQSLIDGFGLDWQILGMKSVKAYPVIENDVPLVDENGDPVKAVNTFVELNAVEIANFINPLTDEENNEMPRTGHVKLSQFTIKGKDDEAWSIDVD